MLPHNADYSFIFSTLKLLWEEVNETFQVQEVKYDCRRTVP